MPGSDAVGLGLGDGTAGGSTAVVTAAVRISAFDDIVCAAKELTGTLASDADLRSACGSASTFTSAASTLTSTAPTLPTGAGVPEDFAAGLCFGGAASFVGAVVSSSSFDDELVLAPPVLTTTPFGAREVVDPVDVDVASEPVVCSVGAVAVALAASVESDEVAFVDDSDVEDGFEGDESGVSAHATPQPNPVTTAAPTPRAMAKPPTRPTNAAAFMDIAIRPLGRRPGGFRESVATRGWRSVDLSKGDIACDITISTYIMADVAMLT